MEKWLDVPQLAKETKIPATTIHRYLGNFKQFFIYKGGKRSRRYESSAIVVLLRIKDLYSKGFGSEEVEKRLSNEFPVLLNNEQSEVELDKTGLPTLATAVDMAELKELLKMLLQKDAERTERDNQIESFLKALPSSDQPEMNNQFIKDQQEINKLVLQELAESKQREQLLLEKLTEKEEAAKPPEEKKKGLLQKFFKK